MPLEAQTSPIRDSVNIPYEELGDRMQELPPKDEPLVVAAEPGLAAEVIQYLAARERRAVRTSDYDLVAPALFSTGRLWEPNDFLMEVLPGLRPGRATDLGSGTGRNSVAMASLGWFVTAIDILPEALGRGRALAAHYLPKGSGQIEWVHMDLETGAVQLPVADLVASFFYLNRELLANADQIVAPGGSIVLETFTTTHREVHGKPRREHLALRPGELKEMLPSFEVLHYEEGWHGDRHTARYLGQRR